MSIITFWNSSIEETGKTMSIVAIATYMAIEHNKRILVVSTTDRNDSIQNCFWQEKKKKKNLGLFGPNTAIDMQNGINGLARVMRSNKLSPNMITNYAKTVFKDRLEILLGTEEKEENIEDLYPEIIKLANQYYDIVLVDLDNNIREDIRETILHDSNLIIASLSQRLKNINNFITLREENQMLKSPKTLILIGRYDKFSKYTSKNITRYLGERNQVLTIPYNTLFFEASEEAGVPDLFLRLRKQLDSEDRNAIFISEVKRATENIIYRLQDLQMNM